MIFRTSVSSLINMIHSETVAYHIHVNVAVVEGFPEDGVIRNAAVRGGVARFLLTRLPPLVAK